MSSIPLRIAYFGLPLGALALAQAGLPPRLIALGHPDAPGARRVRRLLGPRALLLGKPNLEDAEVASLIGQSRPDVLLSWFWPKQIPETLLKLAPRGAFGVHPSLLPRWRGPDPYYWAILAGDTHTGVSLHRLEREYDTGHVVAQQRVRIAPEENAWKLAKRLDAPGLALLVTAAQALASGQTLPGAAQDESHCTQAPQPDGAACAIDWHAPAESVVRQVRALAPYPGAHTELGEDDVEVLQARRFGASLPRALEPGDAVASDEGVVIRTGDGGVLLERVRDADGTTWRGREIARFFPSGLFQLSRLKR
jgi:methionyl-tRNA formyltransferase